MWLGLQEDRSATLDTTLSWKGKHHPAQHERHAQEGEENGGPILEPFLRRFFRGK